MQQQVHYSVSIHAIPSLTATAQHPNAASAHAHPVTASTSSPTNPSTITEPHAGHGDGHSPQNGFKTIKDAARRDFFTIRADAIQDGALALLDSLAEYLVWDGMDRRLRAVASATHTEYPEAVVSVQQIANDIKIRVGHDLCDRTIERALKKLCDVGLLSATARFHQGRRQASSYMLLYAPSMSFRLENSRRGGIPKSQAVSDTPPAGPYRSQALDIQESPYNMLTRISDRIPTLFMRHDHAEESTVDKDFQCGTPITACSNAAYPGDQPTMDREKSDYPSDLGSSAHSQDIKQNYRLSDDRISSQPRVCRSAHSADETTKLAVPGEAERVSLHPTSMSPLFKKEKQNKKVFKNVVYFSGFSKKEGNQADCIESEAKQIHGYYLDVIHQAGWVDSKTQALQKYIGNLSKFLFFSGYRTMEAMTEWFERQERDLQSGKLNLADILANAGVDPSPLASISGLECRYGA